MNNLETLEYDPADDDELPADGSVQVAFSGAMLNSGDTSAEAAAVLMAAFGPEWCADLVFDLKRQVAIARFVKEVAA